MRLKNLSTWLAAVAFLLLGGMLRGSEPTLVGRWRTIDDNSGKPRGVVHIYEQNGEFYGTIESAFDPEEAKERCDKCPGERRNQPVLGLKILHGVRKNGDEYSGGDILDPDTGSVYRCKMHLSADGSKLIVRGYIGISVLGRSQVWTREP